MQSPFLVGRDGDQEADGEVEVALRLPPSVFAFVQDALAHRLDEIEGDGHEVLERLGVRRIHHARRHLRRNAHALGLAGADEVREPVDAPCGGRRHRRDGVEADHVARLVEASLAPLDALAVVLALVDDLQARIVDGRVLDDAHDGPP